MVETEAGEGRSSRFVTGVLTAEEAAFEDWLVAQGFEPAKEHAGDESLHKYDCLYALVEYLDEKGVLPFSVQITLEDYAGKVGDLVNPEDNMLRDAPEDDPEMDEEEEEDWDDGEDEDEDEDDDEDDDDEEEVE